MDRLEHIKWFRKEHPRSEHYPTDMKEKLAAFRRACRSGQAALAYVRAGQTSDGTCCTGRGSRLRQRPTRSPKASLGRWCSCRRSPAFDSVRLRLSAGPTWNSPSPRHDPSSAATVHVVEAVSEISGVVSVGPTKTKGSRRTVPIPDVIAEMLPRMWEASPDDLLFPTPTGLPGPGPVSGLEFGCRP